MTWRTTRLTISTTPTPAARVGAVLVALVAVAALAQAEPEAPAGSAAAPLHLADVVRLASSATPAVELAELRRREASAREGQARGALLPSLSGTASDANRTFSLAAQGIAFPAIPGLASPTDPIGPVETFDARLRVTQPVIDVASVARLRAAGHGTRQALADRAAASEAAAQGAAQAYLRAARAQATLAAREADERIAEDLLGLAEAQQAAGTAPNIDAIRARSQVATTRSQRALARNQLDRSLIDLARTLGRDPGVPLGLADTLGSEMARSDAPEVVSTAMGVAFEHRGELAAERERHARASAEGSAISLERLPRIDASADWGLSGPHAEGAFTTRQYGVAATMPLFDGLRRESRLAEQNSVIRESEVRERDLRDQVAAEVRGALLDLESGREQQAIAAERLALAAEELSQARERFVNGVAGNIEIINAQSSMVRARDADIDARFATSTARVALARAAGVARTLR